MKILGYYQPTNILIPKAVSALLQQLKKESNYSGAAAASQSRRVALLTEPLGGPVRTPAAARGRILPDEEIHVNWVQFGTDEDAVLQTAVAWLQDQPGCAK